MYFFVSTLDTYFMYTYLPRIDISAGLLSWWHIIRLSLNVILSIPTSDHVKELKCLLLMQMRKSWNVFLKTDILNICKFEILSWHCSLFYVAKVTITPSHANYNISWTDAWYPHLLNIHSGGEQCQCEDALWPKASVLWLSQGRDAISKVNGCITLFLQNTSEHIIHVCG